MSWHPRRLRPGYSILEVVIVLGLIAVLSSIGWFGYRAVSSTVRAGAAEAEAASFDRAIRALAMSERGASSAPIDQPGFLDLTRRTFGASVMPTVLNLPIPNPDGIVATPDGADVDITGDIDLRACIEPTTWDGVGDPRYLIGKYHTTAGSRSYRFWLPSSGRRIAFGLSEGSDNLIVSSSVDVGFADGEPGCIRATWEQATKIVRFYTRPLTGTDWVQLGDDAAIDLPSIRPGTSPLTFGRAAGIYATGVDMYSAEVRSGIDGTVVAGADFTQVPAGTTTFSDGVRTYNVIGAASVMLVPRIEVAFHESRPCVAFETSSGGWARVDYGTTFNPSATASIAGSEAELTC